MTNEELIKTISDWFPNVEFTEEGSQFLNVIVPKDSILEVAQKLKAEVSTSLDYMFSLTCVDWPDHFQMIYHLKSSEIGHMLVLKVKLEDKENPEVETLCNTFKTADFHEREVYDLFGVKFLNHPDLRRLFLTDDWVGHPLRKDYVDEINIVSS